MEIGSTCPLMFTTQDVLGLIYTLKPLVSDRGNSNTIPLGVHLSLLYCRGSQPLVRGPLVVLSGATQRSHPKKERKKRVE